MTDQYDIDQHSPTQNNGRSTDISPRALALARYIDRQPDGVVLTIRIEKEEWQWGVQVEQVTILREFDLTR